VVGLNSTIVNFLGKKEIPHLLFYGPAGTGKTTTALIIKKLLNTDCLMLNASTERGIDIIKQKVKTFASTVSMSKKIKLIFLDEADGITLAGQDALRNTMETYASNCRFILTCNYINKISNAIKSRCQPFKFELPKKEDIFNRLKYIIQEEHIYIDDEVLNTIIDNHYPDIRSCINKLESLHIPGKQITIEMVNKDQLIVSDLFAKIQTEKLSVVRQWVLDNNVDYSQLLIEMYFYVFENIGSLGSKAIPILNSIKICNRYLNHVVSRSIEFELMLLEIKRILGK